MKLIYICSPLRGDTETNRAMAMEYCEYVYELGHYPIAPHAQLSWLDDDDERDRAEGMAAGIDVLRECDEVWVFGDTISEGMRAEIAEASRRRVEVVYMARYGVSNEKSIRI